MNTTKRIYNRVGSRLQHFGRLDIRRSVLSWVKENCSMHSEASGPDDYERERKEANERYERQRAADHEASEQRRKKSRKAHDENRKRDRDLND